MTLKELLEKHGISGDAADDITEHFEAETEISKKAHSKNNRENIALKSKLRSYEGALVKLGFDVDSEDLEDQIEEKLTSTASKSDVNSQLEKKIASLTKKFEEKEKREQELTMKLNNKTISSKLRKALKSGNVKVIDDLEDLIIDSYLNSGKAKVLDDNEVVFINSDGDEISLEEEVEAYKSSYPGRFSIDQKPGAGTTTTTKKKNVNNISESEFNSMSGRERAEYAKENPDFVLT